jgi:hypothetical protein
LLTLSGHTYSVTSVAFRPDGKRLASASRPTDEATNGEVKIWDLETGKQLFALSGFEGGIYSVVFSPDGRMLAAAGVDRNVHVWDAENGRQLLVLRGHEDTIIRLAFSADGKCIASASVDRTVRVWDLSNPSDASNTAASPEASPTPEMAIQPSPTPETATKPSAALGQLPSIVAPVPTPQTRQAQPVDFLIGIDALLTSHDYADLSHYLHETTYYFGKRDATKAWIKNDMENDARTYAWCRTVPDLSTYHEWIDASGNTHQAMNEETWAQERTGRKHHAHCRLEIVRSGSGIIEFHLDVLKGHP